MRYHYSIPLSSYPCILTLPWVLFSLGPCSCRILSVFLSFVLSMRSDAMIDTLLYLLSATAVAAFTPSEPQISTPEPLPLSVSHSNNQPINLNSTARPDNWNETGVEGYRNLLLPGIAGMHLAFLPLYLPPMSPHPLLFDQYLHRSTLFLLLFKVTRKKNPE